ncbi:MAG: tRNA epoxyqueuosine(34) reductase QueG [Chitinophagaceae bacterium]|nr:tRNA epoxyqueuosine(34) reductase QueG [Chitinophagaceae bacterium]MCW5905123.1 tRNA epoxyqueuosine(34) reductase QueG [Chitinophagaceae bacterium]
MDNSATYSQYIKQKAAQLGFTYCGIAKAVFLSEDAKRLEQWLSKGMHGSMQYMENYFDLRTDPQQLVPDAKSVITLLMNYYPKEKQEKNIPKISKYAYGIDYHFVIKDKLKELLADLNEHIGTINGRGFVDSAPVLEKTWAVKSGLGWVGKNGILITRQSGSFNFIATLIVDIALAYDNPFAKDFCGSCTKCIDSCPTDAIQPNKVINASKCISYYTIELKDALIEESAKGKFDNWMFGCDICQDVCPWNRFSKATEETGFTPIPEILNLTTKQWEEMSEETFRKIFKNSPLKRSKYKGIMRNIKFLQEG